MYLKTFRKKQKNYR